MTNFKDNDDVIIVSECLITFWKRYKFLQREPLSANFDRRIGKSTK